MKIIEMNLSNNPYTITIGQNILKNLKEIIKPFDKILFLTNETIYNLYPNTLSSYSNETEHYIFKVPDGENFKNIDTAMEIYTYMLQNNFSRNSLIVCFGGGVICDLGGFVASTFMRGIEFLQIPTTLLSQVDASIGGKVAVNHPLGKNMIGNFKQPIAVLIDPIFLKTLPKNQFLSGMGEVIKHSIISKDNKYYDFLKINYDKILNLDIDILIDMIYGSCMIKKEFVEKDEYEKGERAILNLGHTYAHALENIFEYRNITHGISVTKGIIFELYLAHSLNYIEKRYIDKIKRLFILYSIDATPLYINEDTLINIMKTDKKNSFDSINFILKKEKKFVNENVSIDIIKSVNLNFKENLKAIFDIGSNSCKLLIAKRNELGKYDEIFKDLITTRLGYKIVETGKLSTNSLKDTYRAIEKFKDICYRFGVINISAFATSAVREASNSEEFIRKVKKEYDIDIEIISGDKEAKLSFIANSFEFLSKIATIDIGGGSTEIAIGEGDTIKYSKSFPIGVVKLNDLFFKNDSYTHENIKNAYQYLNDIFKELRNVDLSDTTLIGVSGTMTTNVTVIKNLPIFCKEIIHNTKLSIEDFNENLKLFLSKPLEERKKIVGLIPSRASVIISGNIIILSLLSILNKSSIVISALDSLDGKLLEE